MSLDAETIKKAINPLEWIKRNDGMFFAVAPPLGMYSIEDGRILVRLQGAVVANNLHTLDEAKSAAQADYEARIISALSPEFLSALDTQSSRTEAMRKALELADGRLSLLLRVYPDDSDRCDHPVATKHVLAAVQSALLSTPNPGDADGWRAIEEINVREGERFYAAEPEGDGWVVGVAVWCKTPHVPLYGFHFTEGDPENWNMCKPTLWQPLPAPPASSLREGDADA